MLFESLLFFKELINNIELFNLIEALIVVSGLTMILIVLTILISPTRNDREKGSSYECGFEPFEDARTNFDIHFYIVGLLFLVFDLEIVFLYPWIYSVMYYQEFYSVNLFTLITFLSILGIGFIYEWRKQALNWSPSQ